MKCIDLAHRVSKMGLHALAVAIFVLMGMIFAGSPLADTTTVLPSGGSSTPAVQDMGMTVLNPSSSTYPGESTAGPYPLSTVDFSIQTPSIDALGMTTTANPDWQPTPIWNGFIWVPNPGSRSFVTTYDNTITLLSGKNITGRTLLGTTLASIYSESNRYDTGLELETNYNYTTLAGGTFNLAGNNTVNGIVGGNLNTWTSAWSVDPLYQINLQGYNVTFGDEVYAVNTYIHAGTNNTINNDYTFYKTLYSNLTFYQAASVLLNGGLAPVGTASGHLNYGGYNSYVTLGQNQTIAGNVTTSGVNGTLIFQGAGIVAGTVASPTSSLAEVRLNGVGNVLFTSSAQAARIDYVNYKAAALVGFNGGLNLTVDQSSTAFNQVAFNQHDGILQIGNNGSLTGNADEVVVSTTGNNLGTVTMVSGTQAITGNIGSAGHAIKRLNIGGENTGGLDLSTANYSTTTANGDIYAQSIMLNNNGTTNGSSLIMASGYDIYSTVGTGDANMGTLTLVGGAQSVSGQVGADALRLSNVNSGANGAVSSFGADVYSVNVTNTGAGTSNFATNVTATNIYVDSGTSNFTNNVTAETARIGSGVGNFNTNGTGTTTLTNLNFTGAGTANLYNGLAFTNLNYAGNNATVNVSAGKSLTGTAITTATTSGTGYLNMLGGDQTVNATVGATGLALNKITAGADSATTRFTNGAAVYANTLEVVGTGEVRLSGGLVGNLNYTNNVSGENGTVSVAPGKDVIGTVSTGSTGLNGAGSQGILTMASGTQQVSGAIGASGAALRTVNAGANGAITSLNGSMTYADTLQYSGNGTVVLNGTNGGGAVGGLVGTVDFGTNLTNTGALQIGDGVNLTTGAGGINFRDANGATLTFLGTSTVTGEVGALATLADTLANSTLKSIYAGAAGKTVTFNGDVHVSGNTFHVGAGTVNLAGDLYGPLLYDADGTVNVSNTKSIKNDPLDTTVIGTVKTATNNTGTLNYLGSTTLSNNIGESALYLKAVNFHSDSTVAAVSQNIDKNIYAKTTTIGNATTGTTANITATGKFLGDTLTLAAANVTLNTAGAVASTTLSPVDFAHTKNVNGTLTNTATVTQSTTGTSAITTNDATMNFAVGTAAYVAGGTNGVISAAGSSSITGGAGSTLVMNGSETVNISLLGSTRNGETIALIDVDSGVAASTQAATLKDNSFVIDTALSRSATGDLVLTTSRVANTYVTKSGTAGHFSNAAATGLGTLAASGTGYTSDMQTVLNKLDIDQWGYGNNQANLAAQVQLLAPIANMSLTQSALSASNLVLTTAGERLTARRSVAKSSGKDISDDTAVKNGLWIKAVGSHGTQKQDDSYDGYTLNQYGLTGGADRRIGQNFILGAALGFITADVNQKDFRDGDTSRINNYQLMGYASYDITKSLYAEAVLSGAYNRYDGQRLAAVGRKADYDFNGSQFGARLGMGYGINLGSIAKFTPMASLNYTRVAQSSYTETGAGALNLRIDSQTFDRLQSGLGGRLAAEWSVSKMTYRPEVAVNWFYNAGTLNKDIVASFEGGGGAFTTPTASVDRNTGNLGLAFTALYDKAISFKLGYNLDISKNYVGHTGSAYFCWAF